jgi:hypothetical protein
MISFSSCRDPRSAHPPTGTVWLIGSYWQRSSERAVTCSAAPVTRSNRSLAFRERDPDLPFSAPSTRTRSQGTARDRLRPGQRSTAPGPRTSRPANRMPWTVEPGSRARIRRNPRTRTRSFSTDRQPPITLAPPYPTESPRGSNQSNPRTLHPARRIQTQCCRPEEKRNSDRQLRRLKRKGTLPATVTTLLKGSGNAKARSARRARSRNGTNSSASTAFA